MEGADESTEPWRLACNSFFVLSALNWALPTYNPAEKFVRSDLYSAYLVSVTKRHNKKHEALKDLFRHLVHQISHVTEYL